MERASVQLNNPIVVERKDFQGLFDALKGEGFEAVGPTVRDGAIVYDRIEKCEDLPIGMTDEQDGGKYRLSKRDDKALFGYVVGPQSFKKFLHPPRVRLFQAEKLDKGFRFVESREKPPRYAFVGVRSCELHAIAIQDKVFTTDPYRDPIYQSRRKNIFVIAVNCGQAAATCFCVSMKTGPEVSFGYDIALTEVIEASSHYFVAVAGTKRGASVLAAMPSRPAGEKETAAARAAVARAAGGMGRSMDTDGVRELLQKQPEHPRWNKVAERCLGCANCTLVCPTCFCTSVEDTTDLSGEHAERWRRWDSCFTLDFSYIHGGSIRPSARSRYRQWMTHKLSNWIDQFGTSGCVGCGRCITWCPVGIDITEEVKAFRSSQAAATAPDSSREKSHV